MIVVHQTGSLCYISHNLGKALILISKVSHIFHREELLDVLVDAALVHLLVHSGTLGNGWNDVVDQAVELGSAESTTVFIDTARARKDVVASKTTGLLYDDVTIVVIQGQEGGVVLLKLVDTSDHLSFSECTPCILDLLLWLLRLLILDVSRNRERVGHPVRALVVVIIHLLIREAQVLPLSLITKCFCELYR